MEAYRRFLLLLVLMGLAGPGASGCAQLYQHPEFRSPPPSPALEQPAKVVDLNV